MLMLLPILGKSIETTMKHCRGRSEETVGWDTDLFIFFSISLNPLLSEKTM